MTNLMSAVYALSTLQESVHGFVGLRHLILGEGFLQGKERVRHFLLRGVLVLQQALQIFQGPRFGLVGMFELLAAHGLMHLP